MGVVSRGPLLITVILSALCMVLPACGKKGPPSLPQKEFLLRVENLKAEWTQGKIHLRGDIRGPGGSGRAKGPVEGCRVYYARYPMADAPCETCPIEYRGYHDLGPEAVTEERFSCAVPAKAGEISYFRVHLVGNGKVMGPASERVRVAVE